jgi:hypothetical protein
MALIHLNRRAMIRKLTIGIMAVGLSVGCMFWGTAWAGPPKRPPGRVYPKPGRVYRTIPRDHHRVHVGPNNYFYHGGIYYRRGNNGYIVVRPPRGAVIAHLPVGFETLVVAGIPYFLFAGVYYQKHDSGYVVVDEPPGAAVSPEVMPEPGGQTLAVDVEILNVRSGPGMNHTVIQQVHLGDRLVIQDTSPGWCYVQLPDGSFGWVMRRYTRLLAPEAKG